MQKMDLESEPKSQKKRPLDIDWHAVLPDDDNAPPPQLVVNTMASSDHSSAADEDLGRMPEHQLLYSIRSKRSTLERTGRNLKDGGAKIRAAIKRHEDELARRKTMRPPLPPPQEVEEDDKPRRAATGTSNVGVSSDLRRENISSQTPLLSSFASHFVKKMEDDSDCTTGAFRKEMDNFKHNPTVAKRHRSSSRKFPFKCSSNISKRGTFNGNGRATSSPSTRNIGKNLSKCFAKEMGSAHAFQSDSSRSRKVQPIIVDDDDDDDDEPLVPEKIKQGVLEKTEQENKLAEYLKDARIYYPSSDDPECVEVGYSDIDCLAPESYLASNIMNFYIRYVKQQASLTNRSLSDYHFFNTYFYKKLQDAVSYKGNDRESFFAKFRRWWKGVNIFQKAYILIPIHEDLHWSLIIICIPDKEDESGPIILHLDSLSLHSSRSLFDNIKSCLIEERNYLDREGMSSDVSIADRIWKCLPRRIETQVIKVPQQKNDYDCGLFVLYFIQRFIEEAPERLKMKDLAMFSKRWFRPEEASSLRQRIRNLVVAELQKSISHNPVSESSPPSPAAGTETESVETAKELSSPLDGKTVDS